MRGQEGGRSLEERSPSSEALLFRRLLRWLSLEAGRGGTCFCLLELRESDARALLAMLDTVPVKFVNGLDEFGGGSSGESGGEW
jgi:hypothetical protein